MSIKSVSMLSALAIFAGLGLSSALSPALAEGPVFKVDASWPKPLPHNWIMSQVGGMSIDKQDHIWVFQRPRVLDDHEKGLTLKHALCCEPAPAVMEFDTEGNVLNAWGGPGQGYDWPQSEHAIRADNRGNVYLSGNNAMDQMLLKFTVDGKFVKQLGFSGKLAGSQATDSVGQVADIAYDAPTNELYLGDGYGNHRVMVVDADTFGFKRMWGAYGKTPSDEKLPDTDPNSAQFGNPVHCVKIASDGLVYVCDRSNNRIQVFQKDGTFVKQFVYDATTRGSTWNVELWPDKNNTYMVVGDGTSNIVRVVRRSDGVVLNTFGTNGREAGMFHWVHALAFDSKGNLYTGEVDTGKRLQKFIPNMRPAK